VPADRRLRLEKLDKGLCETVGRLMASPLRGRQVAVVPYTELTFRLAQKLAPGCAEAGIEIALVKDRGAPAARSPVRSLWAMFA
jgi:hypothetical protein